MSCRRERVLAERRAALCERSRLRRDEIADALAMLSPGLGIADRLFSAAGWASRHRLLVVGVVAAGFAWSRPRRLFGLATRAWALWRGLHSLGERYFGKDFRERA
ncbi:YqjK family protein [Niveibacterium terrae]|uniref:YqjK family protein n=1 Tax=Niveibacterium terrae TaxID=3373598 RepID=UPI003A93D8C0